MKMNPQILCVLMAEHFITPGKRVTVDWLDIFWMGILSFRTPGVDETQGGPHVEVPPGLGPNREQADIVTCEITAIAGEACRITLTEGKPVRIRKLEQIACAGASPACQ
jgi:hypothetical protein